MRHALTLHPDARCAAVTGIVVEVARPAPRRLALRYFVFGDPRGLVVPAAGASARADGLWRTTCLEAFVRGVSGEAYCEFNMSLSRQWACYRFDGYRRGMAPMEAVVDPTMNITCAGHGVEIGVEWRVDGAPDLSGPGPWRLGLAAVMEEVGGRVSHWALTHPAGRPDFHHDDGFALQLTTMEA
jgi:hypothetical protein